jgi:hypothetical protein
MAHAAVSTLRSRTRGSSVRSQAYGSRVNSQAAVFAEIAGALGILGLLLVFLPLYIHRVGEAGGGNESQRERKVRIAWAWAVPALIGLASVDVTVGLFNIWGKWDTADLTGWLLVALVWLVALLACVTVQRGVD